MIRMEVHPELSAGSVRVEGGFTLPDKEVTQITTNIMCPDGATGLDEFQRAIDDYSEAIRLDAQLAQAYLHRSRAYHQTEQFEHALEDLDEVLELTPDSAEAFHLRGLVLEKVGQSEDASRDFAQGEALRRGVR